MRAKRLSSVRAGNLEEQRDEYRDDVYIDPNRYFRLSNTFGLNRDPWERLARAAPRVLEGITTIEHDRATRRRTRGIAGPNPDMPMSGVMTGSIVPATDPDQRSRPIGKQKKEAKRKRY
jgi:hypothetical protein